MPLLNDMARCQGAEGHPTCRTRVCDRIRARVKLAAEKTWKAGDWYIGPQHNNIEKFVDALLEDGDE